MIISWFILILLHLCKQICLISSLRRFRELWEHRWILIRYVLFLSELVCHNLFLIILKVFFLILKLWWLAFIDERLNILIGILLAWISNLLLKWSLMCRRGTERIQIIWILNRPVRFSSNSCFWIIIVWRLLLNCCLI